MEPCIEFLDRACRNLLMAIEDKESSVLSDKSKLAIVAFADSIKEFACDLGELD